MDLIQTEEAVILASVDYPYEGPRKVSFPGVLSEVPRFRRGIRETQEAIAELLPRIAARKDVYPGRIAIVGASFGAPFAIRAAATTELGALIIVHGFAEVRRTVAHRLSTLWSRRWGALGRWSASLASYGIVAILDPPKPESDALLLRESQSVLMIEATDDSFIPVESRVALWQALERSQAKLKKIPMPGDHLQPGSDALISKIIGLSVDWIKSLGWLAADRSL